MLALDHDLKQNDDDIIADLSTDLSFEELVALGTQKAFLTLSEKQSTNITVIPGFERQPNLNIRLPLASVRYVYFQQQI